MRNLIIISFLLLVGFNGFGQKDTHNKDSLIFILDVVVKGVDNEKYIEGVSVKLYGSDGSEQTDTTDVNGNTSTFKLKPNTSYKTEVIKVGYLSAKGMETTVGEIKSKKYFHEYALQQFCPPTKPLPRYYFDINKKKPMVDSIEIDSFLISIMIDNPTIIVQFVGYRDSTENITVSIERVEELKMRLSAKSIEKDRMVIVDGGVRNYKKRSFEKEMTEAEVSQENRTITIKVISDDYTKKGK